MDLNVYRTRMANGKAENLEKSYFHTTAILLRVWSGLVDSIDFDSNCTRKSQQDRRVIDNTVAYLQYTCCLLLMQQIWAF